MSADSSIPEIGIKKLKTKKSEALWMATFSDLSLLLMCFFALLLSMSTMNIKQADTVVDSMTKTQDKVNGPPRQNLESIYKQIQTEIKKNNLENDAEVKLDSYGLNIEFKSNLLFDSGSTDVNSQFANKTGSIINIVAKSPPKYIITIEGHTDDQKIAAGSKIRSNWELSSLRGISILNEFKKRKIDEKRMRIAAYADTMPKIPIKNEKGGLKIGPDLQTARAANRRVIIHLD